MRSGGAGGGEWGQVVLVVVSVVRWVYMYDQVTEHTCLKYYSQM